MQIRASFEASTVNRMDLLLHITRYILITLLAVYSEAETLNEV